MRSNECLACKAHLEHIQTLRQELKLERMARNQLIDQSLANRPEPARLPAAEFPPLDQVPSQHLMSGLVRLASEENTEYVDIPYNDEEVPG